MTSYGSAKKAIQDKLIEMLEDRPIYEIKVKALTDSLGISRTTFYKHYDSIYDVLEDMSAELLRNLWSDLEGHGRHYKVGDCYKDVPNPEIVASLKFLQKNSRAYCVIVGPNGNPTVARKLQVGLAEIFTRRLAQSNADPKVRLVAADFLRGAHQAILLSWLKHDTGITIDQMAVLMYRMLRSAIDAAASFDPDSIDADPEILAEAPDEV